MQNRIVVKLRNQSIDLKKAEKFVSNDINRLHITGCCFDFKNNRLQYTNTHMLVYFDLEIISRYVWAIGMGYRYVIKVRAIGMGNR